MVEGPSWARQGLVSGPQWGGGPCLHQLLQPFWHEHSSVPALTCPTCHFKSEAACQAPPTTARLLIWVLGQGRGLRVAVPGFLFAMELGKEQEGSRVSLGGSIESVGPGESPRRYPAGVAGMGRPGGWLCFPVFWCLRAWGAPYLPAVLPCWWQPPNGEGARGYFQSDLERRGSEDGAQIHPNWCTLVGCSSAWSVAGRPSACRRCLSG